MRLINKELKIIQKELIDAKKQADEIREKISLGELSISKDKSVDFFDKIRQSLHSLGFIITYTNILEEIEGYGHLSSITFFNDQLDRTKGGQICIYKNYSIKKKRELLMHEFVHIYSELPAWSTNIRDRNIVFMLLPATLKDAEMRTELASLALMMPIEKFLKDLFDCSHDIEKIVDEYGEIKTNCIIQWIILHDFAHAHYAHLFFVKDKHGKENPIKIDEYWRDNMAFDIYNILYNEDSVAFRSRDTRYPDKGGSTIDNRKYYCFCFYERDVQQPLPSNAVSIEKVLLLDEMVVIGWSNEVYEIVKKLRSTQDLQ